MTIKILQSDAVEIFSMRFEKEITNPEFIKDIVDLIMKYEKETV